MKEWAKEFYKPKAWKTTRAAYAQSVGGLCERCFERGEYRSGEIVHHKIHLNPVNIKDPCVSLSWSNLELVCCNCHGDLHKSGAQRRYQVDEQGKVKMHFAPPSGHRCVCQRTPGDGRGQCLFDYFRSIMTLSSSKSARYF